MPIPATLIYPAEKLPCLAVWIELVKAIPSVVTAVTAVVGVSIAARGVEQVASRNDRQALADFYRARDIITAARSPGSFSHEGGTRQKADWETADDTGSLNAYFATIERLIKQGRLFRPVPCSPLSVYRALRSGSR